MDYNEARTYLEEAAKSGSVLGLETMKELLKRLHDPQDQLKFIHISGTNGKGSTLAYISTILKESGYRVGRYISPTLFSYREKIQVNEAYIEKESLAKHVTEIAKVITEMEKEGKAKPTVFEIETALSFLYFAEKNCDIVVLETGLGGAQDATNVIKTTILEVIASISMDHMEFLGDTLEKIAVQKAGIIKEHTTVVTIRQEEEAFRSIKKKAEEMHAKVIVADPDRLMDVHFGIDEQSFSFERIKNCVIHLAGACQISNACLAVCAAMELEKMGFHITEETIKEGLSKTEWRGRFTILSKEPYFIIDGAHNRDAARMLKESVKHYFADKRIICICGVFKDKEYEEVLKSISSYSDTLLAIETPDNPRALPATELAVVAKKYYAYTEAFEKIEDAVEKAFDLADKEDVILAFGSLSHLGSIEKAVAMRR